MEIDYCDVTSELDAREILRYLNNLGIQNISGEVLKYFMTDLKKLIKYDLQQKHGKPVQEECFRLESGPERLHSASTFSSRIRSKCQQSAPASCSRWCQKPKPLGVRNIHSAPVLGTRKVETSEKALRRACTCVRLEKKEEIVSKEKVPSSSSNIIKVPKQQVKKKSDPVSLYHYYTSQWAKYKPNVPGENDWADLRWNVRQKMAGNIPRPVLSKVPENSNTEKCVNKKK